MEIKKNLYFMFVDLEKTFDRIPRKVLWWSMRKLGVHMNGLHKVSKPCMKVCAGSKYSSEFNVKAGVHQGSVLSPLLFTIVIEAISMEYRIGYP